MREISFLKEHKAVVPGELSPSFFIDGVDIEVNETPGINQGLV